MDYERAPYDPDVDDKYISEDDRILKKISRSQRDWMEYYSPNFVTYRIDNTFLFLDQWKTEERSAYKVNKKAIVTANLLYDSFRKMCAQYRDNVPQFEVRSVNGKSNPQEVKLRGDWFRFMSHQSRSQEVFQTALESALAGGFGAFRVDTEYRDKSFDQEPCLRKIEYPERCYFDPNAELSSKGDGNCCGMLLPITKEEFRSRFPNKKIPLKSEAVFEIFDSSYQQVYTNHNINLIEHYEKEYFDIEICELSNGMTMTRDEYKKRVKQVRENYPVEIQSMMIPTIVRTRKDRDYKIMRYLVTSGEILEQEEFIGHELPIIFVPGDMRKVNGREITISSIRMSVDPQRAYNLAHSEIIQTIRTARRELFLATEANVAGQYNKWRDSQNQQGVLIYTPDPETKSPPIRLEPFDIPSSLMNFLQLSQQQIQSTMGIYAANLGAEGNTESGVAERNRQIAGNLSGGIFYNNLMRGIEQAGRCIMSMLHKVFDNERTINTLPAEGKQRPVRINSNRLGEYNKDFTDNEFDVVCRAGPSYAIQKEEAIKMLLTMTQTLPEQSRTLL
ncbi:MAG TPA: portal protein, partial [Rummeliibacillus sp.]|nr:portal protein [Rummeliibacillus sp.]